MRRKSTRGATKASPEKLAEPTTRRSSRRHSRRKRSSSQSSNEDSQETPPIVDSQQIDESVEQPPNIVVEADDTEEPVWKVKASETPSGELQKLKLCLTRPVLSSPEKTESVSSKRRRNKSCTRLDDDVTSSEDVVVTPTRKSRHRGSSGIEIEEVEDKKGKGKSKSKNKSKNDKSQEIQEVKDETQNEISENIQVTPQSPQAASDIRVDNESVSNNENEDINSQINTTEQFSDPIIVKENENESVAEQSQTIDSKVDASVNKQSDETENVVSSESVSETVVSEQNREEPRHESDNDKELVETSEKEQQPEISETCSSVPQVNQILEEAPVLENLTAKNQVEPSQDKQPEETCSIENQVEKSTQDEQPGEICSSTNQTESSQSEKSCDTVNEVLVAQEPVADESDCEMHVEDVCKVPEKKVDQETELAATEIKEQTVQENKQVTAPKLVECIETAVAEDSRTGEHNRKEHDEPVRAFSEETEEHNEQQDEERKDPIEEDNDDSNQKSSLDEKQSFDEEAISVDTIINLTSAKDEEAGTSSENKDGITSPVKINRKRKWGRSTKGLYMTNVSISVNTDTIKELCPTLKFLEENEVQIEMKDRRKSSEVERTNARKVSIEYKINDRLESQTSVSSEKSESAAEVEVDNSNIIAMNRKISIVDDTASKLKPPPSPAKNPLSQVLYITNLVRPFTVKQLKELLERTGKVTEGGFWTDRIKSKCFVCYETVEEAEATRNALHGVNWPICNGKKLLIEYSTLEDMDKAMNPTPPAPAVVQPILQEKENIEVHVQPKKARLDEEEKYKKERPIAKNDQHVREWDIGKEDIHRRRSRSKSPRNDRHERHDRRKYKRSLTPIEDVINKKQRVKEEDVPQKLMDDLFQRTKATPSIYWLPLTPEEIATKQQQRLLRMAEHKRRMEESTRNRGDYNRGAPYRRRYD